MRPPLRVVVDTLQAEGLATDADVARLRETAAAWAGAQAPPWYLHALMLGAAWFAAPCLAVLPLSVLDDETARGVLGLLGLAVVCVLRHRFAHPLAAHVLFAFSAMFHGIVIASAGEAAHSGEPAAAAAAALTAATFLAYPEFLHRALTAATAVVSLAILLVEAEVPLAREGLAVLSLLGAGLLLAGRTPRVLGIAGALARPAAWGLTLAGLGLAAASSFPKPWEAHRYEPIPPTPEAAAIPLGIGLAILVVSLLARHGVRPGSIPSALAVTAVAALTVVARQHPVIPGALAVVLLGFHGRDRVILALAWIGLAWGLVIRWLDTPWSGVPQASSILGAGLVILAAWFALLRAGRRAA